MMMKKKPKNKKEIVIKILIVLALIAAMVLSPSVKKYIEEKKLESRERDTVYCHFKTTVNETRIKREECVNMKIVSKELDRVNLSQFNVLKNSEFFCTKKIDEIPDCENENFYMSKYSLNLFSDEKIDGYVCIAYQINFTTEDTTAIMRHLSSLMHERFDNLTDQRKAFEECEFP